jgi:hypothetical protein
MIDNPFLSPTYTSTWLQHFQSGKKRVSLELITDVDFIKHPYLPYYINVGATHTKGVEFAICNSKADSLKDKTILLYDVPSHCHPGKNNIKALGHFHIPQYMGYLCNLEQYSTIEGYMNHVLSKKTIRKFRSYSRKLDSDYKIEYKYYGKETEADRLKDLFELFRSLLEKRFEQKKKSNNNLSGKEWAFHSRVSIQLIREGKAGLFVMEADNRPITMSLMYFSHHTAIDVMRVFDIDFAKYRPGSISILNQLDWCLKNGYSVLDFSKGHFEYKRRWCNTYYYFEYHIYFDRKSIRASTLAIILYCYYHMKRILREMRLDILWQKLNYRLWKKERH